MRMRLWELQLRLWLRKLRLRLWKLQLQLQLRLQRFLLLSKGCGGTLCVPLSPSLSGTDTRLQSKPLPG